MTNSFTPQKSNNGSSQLIFSAQAHKTHGDVRQDNAAQFAARAASVQPVPSEQMRCAVSEGTIFARSQMRPNTGQKLERVVAYIPCELKAELQRLADQGGKAGEELSLSAVICAFLQKQSQGNIDMQYGALLGPTIRHIHREELRSMRKFFTLLLVRIAFATEQTRSMVTNILNRQPGMTDEVFKDIVRESARSAKKNIIRKTPQIIDLIDTVERWMAGETMEQEQSMRWQSSRENTPNSQSV
jgi:hypothetical protein